MGRKFLPMLQTSVDEAMSVMTLFPAMIIEVVIQHPGFESPILLRHVFAIVRQRVGHHHGKRLSIATVSRTYV